MRLQTRFALARVALVVGVAALFCAPTIAWKDRPLDGDPAHGAKLFKKSKKKLRVDGNWINGYSDKQCLTGLKTGKGGFPKVASDNPLDAFDVIQFIRSANIDLRDLIPEETTHMLVTKGVFDKYAEERLTERGGFTSVKDEEKSNKIFVLFDLGEKKNDLVRVRPKQTKMRDTLKPKKKVGYAVVMPLRELRGGGYEVAFVVDKEIKITGVEIVAPDGTRPEDLNRAASRLIGRGARGKYDPLRLVGAGKAVRELQDAISRAFLLGMESIYMYEVKERDYFAFDADDE
jgi:hypothetical protein